MEDDEDTQYPRSPSSPVPNGRISVTVAAPSPPLPPLAIALPAQIPRFNGSGSASAAREDCWSEGATSVLIDAWGERYLQLSRGNLKQQHWKEVADVVAAREDYGKTPKTDVQCKNRIDTVKKKYKSEKAKISAGGPPSRWPFFHRLDHLLGSSTPVGAPPSATSLRSSRIQNQKLKKKKTRRGFYDSDSEPDPPSPESTDSLPPETYPYKRARTQWELNSNIHENNFNNLNPVEGRRGWGESVRELTRAIVKFGEMYERAERSKLQQMVEMEKQRMKFAKELDMQRMQFYMKTQLEISQLKQRSNNHCHVSKNNHNSGNFNNYHHHSDSSS